MSVTVGITTTDGKTALVKSQSNGARKNLNGDGAVIYARDLGDGHFELEIEAQRAITNLLYPIAEHPRSSAYQVLTSFRFGQRIDSTRLKEWGWRGLSYPGPLFAPILIAARAGQCDLLYSDDWPPRKVNMYYSLGREAISMPVNLAAGERIKVRYRQLNLKADWTEVVDVYRAAIQPRIQGLPYRSASPAWMTNAEGFLNVQLENIYRFDIRTIDRLARRWRDVLPWVQFWGQMSHHMDRGKALGEEVGCCTFKHGFHPRYRPQLIDWTRQQAADDFRIGFYTRPTPDRLLTERGPQEDLLAWLASFRDTCRANACYVDVVGAGYFGSVLEVGDVLSKAPDFPMIEGADIYLPFASLMSGAYQIEGAFPEFGRLLMNDRIVFLGESNNGYEDWGAKNGHKQEIRAFLLGAKFDAIHPNSTIRAIARERARVNWWQRSPRFLGMMPSRSGDGSKSAEFVDRDGVHLVVTVEPGRHEPRFTIRTKAKSAIFESERR